MQSHYLEKKSPKRKRTFAKDLPVHGADVREVRRLFGKRGK
jgi:ribosomal protein L35